MTAVQGLPPKLRAAAILGVMATAVLAGCSGGVNEDTSGPAAQPPAAGAPFLRVDCPTCRITYANMDPTLAHQVAADPADPQRAAVALLHTPPVDPAAPGATVPVLLSVASIAVTEDGGQTWRDSKLPDADPGRGTPAYAAVTWAPDGALWATALLTQGVSFGLTAAGAAGELAVYRSADAGRTWVISGIFADGGGYGTIATGNGTVYAAWASDTLVHVAGSSDGGATWTQSSNTNPGCFSVTAVVATWRGPALACAYPFGNREGDTMWWLDATNGRLVDATTPLACQAGGAAGTLNGSFVLASACDGVVEFHVLGPAGWTRLQGPVLDGMSGQSAPAQDANGTWHMVVRRDAVTNVAGTEMVAPLTTHVWVTPNGAPGSAELGGRSDSTDLSAPIASPAMGSQPDGPWFIGTVEDGVLATRFVP